MSAALVAAVGVASGGGAVLRLTVDTAVSRVVQARPAGPTARRGAVAPGLARVPWGTLMVNVSGSLLLGLLVGLVGTGTLAPGALAVVGTGLCGGYTTFSTWCYETVVLLERRAYAPAALNVVGSLLLGLAAAALGLVLGSHL